MTGTWLPGARSAFLLKTRSQSHRASKSWLWAPAYLTLGRKLAPLAGMSQAQALGCPTLVGLLAIVATLALAPSRATPLHGDTNTTTPTPLPYTEAWASAPSLTIARPSRGQATVFFAILPLAQPDKVTTRISSTNSTSSTTGTTSSSSR